MLPYESQSLRSILEVPNKLNALYPRQQPFHGKQHGRLVVYDENFHLSITPLMVK
ncbi:hypothetical protein D3C84_1126500 [compost metagenome]